MFTICIGEIIGCRTNCPGSWHNSRVAEGIYNKLEYETPGGYHIVADAAFPTGHGRIAGKIFVPLKAGENLLQNFTQRKHALQLSRAILSYRQTVEWGMRELQALGAEGVIPGRYIVSLLRVFKQFTHTLPSR